MTFRADVLAYLQRDEYPLLGATTADLPDGVDVSFWHDDYTVSVWMRCVESWIDVDNAADLIAKRISEDRMSDSSPYADLDLLGVICLPSQLPTFLTALEYAEKLGIEVWTFDDEIGFVPVLLKEDEDDELSTL